MTDQALECRDAQTVLLTRLRNLAGGQPASDRPALPDKERITTKSQAAVKSPAGSRVGRSSGSTAVRSGCRQVFDGKDPTGADQGLTATCSPGRDFRQGQGPAALAQMPSPGLRIHRHTATDNGSGPLPLRVHGIVCLAPDSLIHN
ncbi:hypothetical protein ACFRMN_36425 [Streptomyces sp. NPDC056835]|uniref:hypothetical protein n=1 Tax=Streptomyces sp. NPDC056835 TaxID=3345956 RepID=UPI0036A68048